LVVFVFLIAESHRREVALVFFGFFILAAGKLLGNRLAVYQGFFQEVKVFVVYGVWGRQLWFVLTIRRQIFIGLSIVILKLFKSKF
jgi:hypothetical protein